MGMFNFFKDRKPEMTKPSNGYYFVNVTDAGSLAGLGLTSAERTEAELARMGVMPVGRIKSSWKGKVIYRPIYDPSDITSKDFSKAQKLKKLDKLNALMDRAEKLKQEIGELSQ